MADLAAPPYQIVQRPSTPSVSLDRVQDWTESLLNDPKVSQTQKISIHR
jgi:hypothetical protein